MEKYKDILVVEDSTTQAEQLKYLLENHNYKVIVSNNGFDALEKIHKHNPSLVISDVMMPKMNGIDLCIAIKSNEAINSTPIILLTSLAEPEDILRGLECEADNFIIKPYDEHSLLMRVESLLKINDKTKKSNINNAVEVSFNEKIYKINSDRTQILDLLMSTFQNAFEQNRELIQSQMEMTILNEQLEERVEQRTESLISEIYEKKKAEEELITYQNKLERMVDERTSELSKVNKNLVKEIEEREKIEKDLEKKTEDFMRVNEELKQFAYIASHDLQEPLRMISSYTKLLAKRYKDKLDENANDYINYAVDGAVRMQKLIDSLLYYSRIGNLIKKFRPVDLNESVENAKLNLKLLIEETKAIITSEELPTVFADSTQMTQLLQNIISNSLKYKDESKIPEIKISDKSTKKYWHIKVEDNGIGIEESDFERIFLVFQRLHSKHEYSGTGMGLAICKKIVEYHKGKIWLESSTGKGSTFHFTLSKSIENIQ